MLSGITLFCFKWLSVRVAMQPFRLSVFVKRDREWENWGKENWGNAQAKTLASTERGYGTRRVPTTFKEIKRMLSKKMTFSLMRLITIFVLAFAVPSAVAEFNVSMSIDPEVDVSTEKGIQVMTGESVRVRVKFDKVVIIGTAAANFSASDIIVFAYNEFGGEVTAPTLTEPIVYDPNNSDGKNFTITIPATGDNVVSVQLYMPKQRVESVDATGKSDEASIEIYYVGADESPPQVYSIRRPSDSPFIVTDETVQVVIYLSEKPAAFTKDHISVTNATHTDPIALTPLHENEVEGMSSTGRDGKLYFYIVTIMPKHENMDDVVVKVKAFEDTVLRPGPNRYTPPVTENMYREGIDKLTIKVGKAVLTTTATGFEVPTVKTTTAVDEKARAEVTQTPADAVETIAETVKVGVPDTSVMIPMEGEIYISEIMFAHGAHGTLPQWIEISNGSWTEQVNLSGWTLTVENATADTDVSVGAKAKFTIPEGTRIDPSGQNDTPSTVLVVTEQGRNNLDGAMAAGQVVNLWVDQWSELARLGITERRYSLLSEMAFKITLAPPAPDVTPSATDMVGNLADDGTVAWALPMATEGNARSSIIRRHAPISDGASEPKDGTMVVSWVLASDTGFAQGTHGTTQSYYGLPIDVGTPGFRVGGALPVELSHFRPARQKDTGAVVITWATQSELNNAGFFIKRSQQRDGEFKVINATMVPGAGTTSEKQFYTYTDTTAQPNVVYYYQIEDVSFDGDRRTLTRGIRLKGHVGAAGKATTTWGDLKTSNE